MRKAISLMLMIGIMLQMFTVFAYADNWTCRFCNKENDRKFCTGCGRSREEAEYRVNTDIKLLEAGDYYIFGSYEQDNDISNGKEPIEWLVLEVDETNSKALLISRYALDCQSYDNGDMWVEVTWEKCSLRRWLNDEFQNTAFSTLEREMIVSTRVTEDKNNQYRYNTATGNDTEDKIFLLSISETNTHLSKDEYRTCEGTEYSNAHGLTKAYNDKC